jgi:hypothetical protein
MSPGILGDLSPPTGTVVKDKPKGRKRALMDLTGLSRNFENAGKKGHAKGSDLVKERVRDWERERERLREIAALEEMERERDEQPATKHDQEMKRNAVFDKENDGGMENRGLHVAVAQSAPRGTELNRPRSALGRWSLLFDSMISQATLNPFTKAWILVLKTNQYSAASNIT